MRFAYIDSQGNEVTIPSVDALALRIELGAIKMDTELYDAQAERWGPAHTHEIFHTLSRSVPEDDFILPVLPPTVPSGSAGIGSGAGPGWGLPDLGEAPEIEEEAAEMEGGGTDLPLLEFGEAERVEGASEAMRPPPVDASPASPIAPPEDVLLGLELSTGFAADEPEAGSGREEGFDFGDLSGAGLDLSESPTVPSSRGDVGPAESEGTLPGLESPPDVGEVPRGPSYREDEGLDLEPPMSDFMGHERASWTGVEPSRSIDEAMGFGPPAVGSAAPPSHDVPVQETPRERPTPRNRPSPPRPVRRGSGRGAVIAIGVVVLAVGGGYLGWRSLSGEPEAPPARPPVVLPDLPAELLPQMRALAEPVLRETLAEIEARAGGPAEPPEEWLAGVYLANASQFEGVRAFWAGMERLTQALRAEELAVFHQRYLEQTQMAAGDSSNAPPVVAPADAARMTERADSGFMATRPSREAAYRLMDDLSVAALGLHEFLLAHEAEIEYTPATGLSRNPVEEAVPATPEIGEEMWGKVDDITTALDALGTLDRVNRTRLVEVLSARVLQIGIQ